MGINVEQNSRRILRRDLLSFGLKGVALLGLAKIGIACGEDNNASSGIIQETPNTSSQIPSESPTAKATRVPTSEPTQDSAPTENQPTPPCQVLEQQYCRSGKVIEWKNPNGQTLKFVTFNLPEGTPIFSPLDGSFTYSDGPGNMIDPNIPGVLVYIPDDPNSLSFTVTGDLTFDRQKFTIKKGDTIATTQNTNIKVFDSTVAITFTAYDPEKMASGTDEKMLAELFPSLFEK